MDVHIARVSPMLMICVRAVALLFAFSNVVGTSQAELVYTFSGQMPPNTDWVLGTHPQIGLSETWTATLEVDETSPGWEYGSALIYRRAIKSGSLVFSGGYVSPVDFSSFDIIVDNDSHDDRPEDHIFVTNNSGSIHITATSALNPLSSNALPLPGTTIVPGPNDNPTRLWHFAYSDSLGDITYAGNFGTNVFFSATVPEPASLTVASLLGGSLVLARRRR